jgi:hypothetical protein
MLGAVLDAPAYTYRRALTANQFLLFEVLVVTLSCFAVLHSTEVGVRTLEAHVIRKLVQSKLLQIVEEPITRFREPLGLV